MPGQPFDRIEIADHGRNGDCRLKTRLLSQNELQLMVDRICLPASIGRKIKPQTNEMYAA